MEGCAKFEGIKKSIENDKAGLNKHYMTYYSFIKTKPKCKRSVWKT